MLCQWCGYDHVNILAIVRCGAFNYIKLITEIKARREKEAELLKINADVLDSLKAELKRLENASRSNVK
jgi:hypothetical protein